MGRLFVLIGKSSSGKDAIYRRLMADEELGLSPVICYTTRPMREKEKEGVQYHFVSDTTYEEMQKSGHILEGRTYQTIAGPWHYFTADDGQIDLDRSSFLIIGTIDSLISLEEHFGKDKVCPLYIETTDRIRLERAMRREEKQEKPHYAEMCRRYLADEADFSEERLAMGGIERRFENNTELEDCLKELVAYITRQ